MALEFKTPTQIAEEYLTHLKGLKPDVNTDQKDSDWFIRSRVVGGVVSGVYSDIRTMSRDIFPQSAREEAMESHLRTWFNRGFNDPQKANGFVRVTGDIGSVATVGMEFLHDPTGNTYKLTENRTLAATAENFPVESVDAGQDQNLLEGTALSVPSPPAGFDSSAVVVDGDIGDGKDRETTEEASARVLERIRNPLAGGKRSDYEQFAFDADPSVVSSNVLDSPFGLGTVGIAISAGTSDIDTAIDEGIPIVRTPSSELIETVQEYIDSQRPITDCAYVFAPNEIPIDVTVTVRFATGDKDTVLAGQTLTQGELVEREVRRAIYKTPIGGRVFGQYGYVVASEIEEYIDQRLSAEPATIGSELEIVVDRQVGDLAASGANRMILATEMAEPGIITIVEF